MRTARVTTLDRPIEIVDLILPAAGPDQVLVRIEASGLCHTYIHAARGERR